MISQHPFEAIDTIVALVGSMDGPTRLRVPVNQEFNVSTNTEFAQDSVFFGRWRSSWHADRGSFRQQHQAAHHRPREKGCDQSANETVGDEASEKCGSPVELLSIVIFPCKGVSGCGECKATDAERLELRCGGAKWLNVRTNELKTGILWIAGSSEGVTDAVDHSQILELVVTTVGLAVEVIDINRVIAKLSGSTVELKLDGFVTKMALVVGLLCDLGEVAVSGMLHRTPSQTSAIPNVRDDLAVPLDILERCESCVAGAHNASG